jgi:pimeloyl-ACP methyl ester carboxylesterase
MPDNFFKGFAPINGLDIYYEIHGEGKPLVLLHGGGSTIQTTFGTVLPMFAQKHKVIAIELQAHGHTKDRNTPESFYQDAEDVAALLKYLKINSADIFGFSNGGQTAMQLGIVHSGLVSKLVIMSAFYKREGAPEGFFEGFPNATLKDMPQVYANAYLAIDGNDHTGLQRMFERDRHRMENFKGWTDDEIRSIKAPSLIVSGDRDVVAPEHLIEMFRTIPNSRLMILPGYHGSFIGEAMTPPGNSRMPELTVAAIEEFLSEN